MREDNLTKYNVEDTRIQIKKEIEKHEIEKLKWTLALLWSDDWKILNEHIYTHIE